MAFHKDKTDDRKEWLMKLDKSNLEKVKDISSFIHNEFILYSDDSNIRCLPSLVDGLKPSQRKVFYGCRKRNLTKSIKVANLAGYVSEHCAYHHGEMSLNGTIVNLAQDYVGSNNINLLIPDGQFGTRILGGNDAASPRYIFTKLNDITFKIFNKKDDYLLNYLDDDGQSIEPKYYYPIIPMILVNGCEGIGTGFSTKLPSHNPLEIIKNIENLIKGKSLNDIYPWFRYFKGTVGYMEEKGKKTLCTIGNWKIEKLTLTITELPISVWTDKYKNFLETLIDKKIISRYTSESTDVDVNFKITLIDDVDNIIKVFKLYEYNSVKTSNIHLFNAMGQIEKYTIDKIFNDFYEIRLECYKKRFKYLIDKIKYELMILEARIGFIEGFIDDSIIISKKTDEEIEEILKVFPKISCLKFENLIDNDEGTYDYLLNMPMRTMSLRKIEDLNNNRDILLTELEKIKKETPKTLWLDDLKDLKKEIKSSYKN